MNHFFEKHHFELLKKSFRRLVFWIFYLPIRYSLFNQHRLIIHKVYEVLVLLERVFCFQLLTRFYLIWKIRTWNGFACHEKKRKFNWIGVTGFLGNIWWDYFNFCSLFNNMFILRLCITVGILFSLTNTQGTVYFVSFCKLLWNYHCSWVTLTHEYKFPLTYN